MKNFLLKILRFSLPLGLFLISVNFFGDAAHVFGRDYEKKIASLISKNKNVTNLTNYDERVFQEEVIRQLKFTPDIVVIGSSRTMLIRDSLPDVILFNNSVSGASIEDLIAIFQLYKEEKKLPSKIIIGIDPWIFNKNNGQERWKSISRYYYAFFKNRELDENFYKYNQLFSLTYFQNSLNNIPNIISGKEDPSPTNKMQNSLNTKLRDGSLVYGKKFREASNEEIERKAMNYATGNIYGLGDFKSISPTYRKEFQILIGEIKAKNIEVEFFLAPYHPLVFNTIKDKIPAVLSVEDYIRKYSTENNITIYGSYNPLILGKAQSSYFYDGMHLKEKGVKKILKIHAATRNHLQK